MTKPDDTVKDCIAVVFRQFPWVDLRRRCGTASAAGGHAAALEILPGLRLDVVAGMDGPVRISLLSGPPASRRRHDVDWALEAGFHVGLVDDWTKPFPGWSEITSFAVPPDETSVREGAEDVVAIALDWPEPAFVVGTVPARHRQGPFEVRLRNMAPARVDRGNTLIAVADPLGLTVKHFGSWRHAEEPPGFDVPAVEWGRKMTVAEFLKEDRK